MNKKKLQRRTELAKKLHSKWVLARMTGFYVRDARKLLDRVFETDRLFDLLVKR